MAKKQKYYAVFKGKENGVYFSWDRCKEQITGFSSPIYKAFDSSDDAKYFAEHGSEKPKNSLLHYIGNKTTHPSFTNNQVEETVESKKIIVFTDGDFFKDGDTAYSGYGVWFGDGDKKNLSQPLNDPKTTNNRAEMMAAIEAIRQVEDELDKGAELHIYTDSQYVIYCFTSTGKKYKATNYRKKDGTIVPNADLVKIAVNLTNNRKIVFHKVEAHTGRNDELSIGNRHADRLAMSGTLSKYLMTNNVLVENNIITFGKYKNKKIKDVPEDYLTWVTETEQIERWNPLTYRCISGYLQLY
jgi:ribonuclease HI